MTSALLAHVDIDIYRNILDSVSLLFLLLFAAISEAFLILLLPVESSAAVAVRLVVESSSVGARSAWMQGDPNQLPS